MNGYELFWKLKHNLSSEMYSNLLFLFSWQSIILPLLVIRLTDAIVSAHLTAYICPSTISKTADWCIDARYNEIV